MHIQYTATRSIQTSHVVSALVTDSTIDTACGVSWTCGTNWAIASGKADHTVGSIASFSQIATFTAGYAYNVTYDVIGPGTGNAGSIAARIRDSDGASTPCPDNTTTSVSEIIVAGTGDQLLKLTPTNDFNGSIDNIYVSLTTQWDLYPATGIIFPKWSDIVKQRRTDYGNTRTIRRGRDKTWVITTEPILRTTTESDYEEFFDSVSGGESFTIDPYRASSGDSADNPVTVIMVPNSMTMNRSLTSDYFTISFTVRVLP